MRFFQLYMFFFSIYYTFGSGEDTLRKTPPKTRTLTRWFPDKCWNNLSIQATTCPHFGATFGVDLVHESIHKTLIQAFRMVLKTGVPFKILERKCQALIWVGSILIWYDQMNSGWNCRGQQKNSDICGLEGGPNPSKQETCPEINPPVH